MLMVVHITKLVHSCLLVEAGGKTALFDPGNYSIKSGIIKPESLPKLDYIVYTHSHADHFNANFLKDLAWVQQPMVIAPKQVKTLIDEEGIQLGWRPENEDVVMSKADHAKVPWPGASQPDHAAYHFMGMFTHAGDSYDLKDSKAVLALALVAPWGKSEEMIDAVGRLSPKYVVPVHDWPLSSEGRDYYDSRLAAVFAGSKTRPVRVLDAQAVSLDVE